MIEAAMPMRCQPLRCIFQPLGFVLKCRHHSRLATIASRSFFLSEKLLLRKLSETVVVVGNAPYDRPGFLVGHLVGNRASFLCTKAPLCRVPDELLTISLTSSSNLGGFSASECEVVHTSLLFRPLKSGIGRCHERGKWRGNQTASDLGSRWFLRWRSSS